jgi:hypothetical protein
MIYHGINKIIHRIDVAIAKAEIEYNANAPIIDVKKALSSSRRKNLV